MDSKKANILNAAVEVFVKKGFSGASISEIAKIAGINQSLIYHHIGNKQALWKAAKASLLNENLLNTYLISSEDSLDVFLEKIIDQRLAIYAADKRILRLIQWQKLEDSTATLVGGTLLAPTSWVAIIQGMQDRNTISRNYSAELFAIFIYAAVNELLFDSFNFFVNDERKKQDYIVMLKSKLTTLLAN